MLKNEKKITLSAYSALQYNSFGLKLRQCQSSSWRPPWRLDRLERLHQPLCCFSSIRKNQLRLVDFLNLLPNFFLVGRNNQHLRNYMKIFFINIKVESQGRVKKIQSSSIFLASINSKHLQMFVISDIVCTTSTYFFVQI